MSAPSLKVVLQRELGVSLPLILDKEQKPTASWETEKRIAQIAAGLQRLRQACFIPTKISDEQLTATLNSVHGQEYLRFLADWSEKLTGGQIWLDKEHCAPGVEVDTPIVEGIYRVAREGARSAIAAAQQIADGGRFAYALCRPPGHHAGFDWLGGYCYLNNAVVAVRTLLDAGIERVAVIDFDHHFGNGSAALLAQMSEVFYGSIHSSTEVSYPYMKTQPLNDRQVYVSFVDSPEPREFLSGVNRLLEESLKFGCSAVVVSVGYDIVDSDPHGTWNLPPSILQEVGAQLSKTSLPLCMVQEGGYLLSKLDECAFRLGLGLIGESDDGTVSEGA